MEEDLSTYQAIADSPWVCNKQRRINLIVTLVHVWNAAYSDLKWLQVGGLVSTVVEM